MGYQRSVVTRWSKGTAPRDATIQRVANYFGVSPSYLRDEEQKENPVAEMGNEALKENGYYELNEENKKFIDNIIVQLIKSQSGG
jgi:transcriptional regulator with XRE-family HTH domain